MTLSLLQGMLPYLSKGIMASAIPGILRGALLTFFKEQRVSPQKITQWISENKSLWGQVAPNWQRTIKGLGPKFGNTDWFTPDWLINAVRKEYPSVASLFFTSDEAYEWLKNQVEEIKREIIPH
jgi:hypothetical protein